MSAKTIIIVMLVMCCMSSIAGGVVAYNAKGRGDIEGTEEFYVQKYELNKLKGILVDAVAAGAEIVPPLMTRSDFSTTDAYVEYLEESALMEKDREERIARSQPHIDRIKGWCAKYKDAVENFRKSTTIKITYLNGTQVTPEQFYARYMEDVSNAGKYLLFKVCAQQQ